MTPDELKLGSLLADAGTLVWSAGLDRLDIDEPGARLFGVPRAAFGGDLAALLRRLREDARDRVTAAIERAITESSIFDVEVAIDLPSGAPRTLHLRGAVLEGPSGGAERIVLGIRDASAIAEARGELAAAELAAAERETAHRAQLAVVESAARDRGELVGGLSREVRTRLGAVLGMSQLLLDGALAPEQREQIATIAAAGAELLAFTADTIDIAGDGAPAEVELGVVSVRDLVAGAVAASAGALRERGAQVRFSVEPGVPAAVRTDVARLDRALRCVLREAIAAAPAGGAVVVTARATRLAGTLHDLAIDVVEPSSAVPRGPSGSGAGAAAVPPLGRSVAARLMTRMGGRLVAAGELAGGARTALEVSVDEAELAAAPPRAALFEPDPLLAVNHPLRVLVAEDNAVNRRVIAAFLGRLGYRARFATTGREAIDAVAREPFDLVFMDVQMPELDGLEASRVIKQGPPSGAPPPPRIVALTANALPTDRAACLRAGCDDYIAKPITLEKLAAALVATPPTPEQPAAAAALDDRWLTKLDVALGAAALGEILAVHEADARELVHELHGAAERQDAAAIVRLARTLAQTGATLGATTLAVAAGKLAQSYETCEAGATGELAGAAAAVERIARDLAEARLALGPRLPTA